MEVEPGSRAKSAESNEPRTSPSPNRLRYQAEVDLIVKKVGDLEVIRGRLGLSRRKICQLLLVDPSAWTRWTTGTSGAPPHIYRALEWYLALTEKDPRALFSIGSWSTTAFEERFQALEQKQREIELQAKPGSAPLPIMHSEAKSDVFPRWILGLFLLFSFLLGLCVARYV